MTDFNDQLFGFMSSGIGMIGSLIVYVYIGFCLMTIGQKQGRDDGWMGFIPIANLWYMCVLGGYSGWLFLLFAIPLVNAIWGIVVWWAISEKMGKPGWYALLLLIPGVNLFVPAIVAFM